MDTYINLSQYCTVHHLCRHVVQHCFFVVFFVYAFVCCFFCRWSHTRIIVNMGGQHLMGMWPYWQPAKYNFCFYFCTKILWRVNMMMMMINRLNKQQSSLTDTRSRSGKCGGTASFPDSPDPTPSSQEWHCSIKTQPHSIQPHTYIDTPPLVFNFNQCADRRACSFHSRNVYCISVYRSVYTELLNKLRW